MNGRRLMIGLLAFTALFAAALIWFQFFAYYQRQHGLDALTVAGDRCRSPATTASTPPPRR